MKGLPKFAFAAMGAGAFGFLVWKSDQGPTSVVREKVVRHPTVAPGGGSQKAKPVESAAALGSTGKAISPVAPEIGFASQEGTGIPAVAPPMPGSIGGETPSPPSPQKFSPAAAAAEGPAVVDLPMESGRPVREISIPVPEGEVVPAVFKDDTPKPPPQMRALDRIAAEFEQNVGEIPPGMTQGEVWGLARQIADERYLTLYGFEAYNRYHTQAAKEALREKRARVSAAGP
jgi:hypothetical protein